MAQLSRIGRLQAGKTALFVCDMQERFTTAIYQWKHIEAMSIKMLKTAQELSVPVYATEQNPKALGSTVQSLASLDFAVPIVHKTKFSMVLPPIMEDLTKRGITDVALVGIESHVCVLQTALDLLAKGIGTHVLADAVSSCNPEERPVAFQRMRDAGAHITSTESFMFQLLDDASHPKFKTVSGFIKASKNDTREALKALSY